MNPDSSGRKPSFFETQVQKGQQKLSSAQQSGHDTFVAAQQKMQANFEQARTRAKSMSTSFQSILQDPSSIPKHVDHQMQEWGISFTNFSRERVKWKPTPNDGLILSGKKWAYNKSVDVLADNANWIMRTTGGFLEGVGEKTLPATKDKFHPSHLLPLVTHPELRKRYMEQRWQQLKQPYDFVMTPGPFMKKKWGEWQNGFWNMKDHYSALDGWGGMTKAKHGGRTVVDLVQENAGAIVGTLALTMAAYSGRKKMRQQTTSMMDYMFPKNKIYGQAARVFPVKLLFSKPLAKMRAHPLLTAGIITYTLATTMGKQIKDSMALEKEQPETFKRLKQNGSEMYRSSFHRNARASIQETGTKKHQ